MACQIELDGPAACYAASAARRGAEGGNESS